LKFNSRKKQTDWFLSNELVGMSLYVDRFCGTLKAMPEKLNYLVNLGVNLLHLMPLFKSPADESDGGYAVSDFREVESHLGTLNDLIFLRSEMERLDMNLMIDIVLNHTSNQHEWAIKAKNGDKYYQQFFYMFDNRDLPDAFDRTMPDIFPEVAPGNFTYIPELNKWVMTVFHNYQWDLNYTNPFVFVEMLKNIFFYANIGVDILRIDAPAFIWKQLGTKSQNLPQAHTLLCLIKQCVVLATPGMALLAEAIVAPEEIINYFGKGKYIAKESDFAYNATQMALQWDAMATGDVRVMMNSQHDILQKPYGTSWITYTRCHDDIGLGYNDYAIRKAGFDAYQHRKFLKEYYSGEYPGSMAMGALFGVNLKTQDARISGSLASLCGLEKALTENDKNAVETSVKKIILMQAFSFFIGGVPVLFYGDELGYTNDYSYLEDESKNYDNRWMHRPKIDWKKNDKFNTKGTVEKKIFTLTKELIGIRKNISVLADKNNLTWLSTRNNHVAGFLRALADKRVYCLFNFYNESTAIDWRVFKEHGMEPAVLYDHFKKRNYTVGNDNEQLILEPYQFLILENKND
jgi:amylosucrase